MWMLLYILAIKSFKHTYILEYGLNSFSLYLYVIYIIFKIKLEGFFSSPVKPSCA